MPTLYVRTESPRLETISCASAEEETSSATISRSRGEIINPQFKAKPSQFVKTDLFEDTRKVAPARDYLGRTGSRSMAMVATAFLGGTTSSLTRWIPCAWNFSTLATLYETSMILPGTTGPRSLIRTTTARRLCRFVTFTKVPSGRVGCAAVRSYML